MNPGTVERSRTQSRWLCYRTTSFVVRRSAFVVLRPRGRLNSNQNDEPERRTKNDEPERSTTNGERRTTMSRVLILATTTGYQTRAFGDAATRLGIELVFATDRCHLIEDPWQDHAIPIRFYDEDGSVTAVLESAASRPTDGLIVVG